MNSILSKLPPELLDRVFFRLQEDKAAIRNCRLVCSIFKDLSSKFLLNRIIFARRLDAIKRMQEIMHHPYFSQHITELVYDASAYDSNLAVDFNAYLEDCDIDVSDRLFFDDAYVRSKSHARIWNAFIETGYITFGDLSEEPSPTQRRAWLRSKGLELSLTQPEDDTASRCNNQSPDAHPGGGVEDNVAAMGSEFYYDCDQDVQEVIEFALETSEDEDDIGYQADYETVWSDKTYEAGHHRSWPRYRKSYLAEEQIIRYGIDWDILAAAFRRLPKVRHIIFADWRYLAFDDESFSACARRLFGNVLHPDPLPRNAPRNGDMFMKLLERLAAMPGACIESVVMPLHKFEDETHDFLEEIDPRHPIYINDRGFSNAYDSGVRDSFRNLTHLRLALEDPGRGTQDFFTASSIMASMLAAAPNLTHLSLRFAETLLAPREGLDDVSVDISNTWTWITHLHVPKLKCLHLETFGFPQQDMQVCLSRHRSTLRELHLLDCIVIGDAEELAKWGGQNLALDGIELSFAMASERLGVYGIQLPSQWLEREQETLWLNGRPNRVVRRPRPLFFDSDSAVPWYLQDKKRTPWRLESIVNHPYRVD